jgi:uncharacterized protein (DUF2236 family)
MQTVRHAIRDHVHKLVGAGARASTPALLRRDSGLFGPGSACWKVHGDFTSMMIGGVGALLLQMLHPGALAGVWDHSNFRADMSGRLRRTAQFIGTTTYGSTEQAEALIARVRHIHDRVSGHLPDGQPYSANDPDLLTWVHVAEVSLFMRAYVRYRDPFFSGSEQDRYLREAAVVAERLGATSVPKTRREVERYFAAMRPLLRSDARTREVSRVLLAQPASNAAVAPFQKLFLDAGVDILPAWAARMHGMDLTAARRAAIRTGVVGVGGVLRWSTAPAREPAPGRA